MKLLSIIRDNILAIIWNFISQSTLYCTLSVFLYTTVYIYQRIIQNWFKVIPFLMLTSCSSLTTDLKKGDRFFIYGSNKGAYCSTIKVYEKKYVLASCKFPNVEEPVRLYLVLESGNRYVVEYNKPKEIEPRLNNLLNLRF